MFEEMTCSGLLANLSASSPLPDSSVPGEIPGPESNRTILSERKVKIFSRSWCGAVRHPGCGSVCHPVNTQEVQPREEQPGNTVQIATYRNSNNQY